MVRAALVESCWKTMALASISNVGSRYATWHFPTRLIMDANTASDFLRWLTAFLMDADSKPAGRIVGPANAEFSFRRAFARHWQSSVRYYGLRHTLVQVGEAAYRFFREFLPDRRKARYGDLDYDFDHSVDTTRANVGFRAQLTAALSGHQYFPTEPWLFEQIMQAVERSTQL